MHTISLVPFLFAGVFWLWRKKYLLGAAVTATAFSLLIYANHVQITYYTMLTLLILGVVLFVYTAAKTKDWKHLVIVGGIIISAGLIGALSNAASLWATYEYGTKTIRGKSELTSNNQSNGGLDRDYAYGWSNGKLEVFTLLIPNFVGGSSHAELSEESTVAQKMREGGVPPQQVSQYIKRMPIYWGAKPFTSGPAYLGAIMCFLFVLGLFVVESRPLRW